jgi:glycosyltransferase involved in cell wall biosynthesis
LFKSMDYSFHAATNRKLRLLIYTDSMGIGGAEISLSHLVDNLSESIDVAVVGVSRTVVQSIVHRRSSSVHYVLPQQGVQAWFDHWRLFQRLRPDIIHFNLCTPWAGAIGLSAALTLPKVRVVRVDQLPLRTTDAVILWRTRALCLRVDAHVAVGEASARRMEDFYALGRHSVISIPNGVPDQEPPTLPQNRSSQHLTVGSVGRLDAMKAHDILLRAIAKVDGARVVILGEGEQRTALKKLAIELGISDRVELPGWVENPRAHLTDFDVVALPSRSEGFPLAMVEAMLAARPVVATRVGSMPEAVIDHKTGLLIEKDDVAGLAQALSNLRDQPELRLQLGEQARELAKTHFTVEAMTTSYEMLWNKLLSSSRTPRIHVPRPKD